MNRTTILALLLTALCVAQEPTYELVLTSGRIVDGRAIPGSMAILRCAAIASHVSRLRDCFGTHPRASESMFAIAFLSPGFIDIQGGSANPLTFGDGRVVSHVAHGTTTEIMGERWTPAPANQRTNAAGESLGRPAAETKFEASILRICVRSQTICSKPSMRRSPSGAKPESLSRSII